MTLKVRTMTGEEQGLIERLAHTRTAPAGIVRRAQIIWAASQGQRVPQLATRFGVSEKMARRWLKRFNVLGIAGLEKVPRSGRPVVYQAEQIRIVIAIAQSDPKDLGQSFSSWTLDTLVHYLQEVKGISIKRSRMSEIFLVTRFCLCCFDLDSYIVHTSGGLGDGNSSTNNSLCQQRRFRHELRP